MLGRKSHIKFFCKKAPLIYKDDLITGQSPYITLRKNLAEEATQVSDRVCLKCEGVKVNSHRHPVKLSRN